MKRPSNLSTARAALLVGALALLFTGCEHAESGPLAESAAEEASELQVEGARQQARPGQEGKRGKHAKRGRHGKRGKGGMLFKQALKELDLSAVQREKVSALRADMKSDNVAGSAHKALGATLAAGVRAGQLDESAIESALSQIEKQMVVKRDTMTENLNALHALLTPEQRSELVGSVGDKMDDMHDKWGGADEGEHEQYARRGKKGKKGRLMKMVRDLELSEEQRGKLRESMGASAEGHDRDAMKAKFAEKRSKMKTMMESFQTDSFDAAALMAGKDMSGHMRGMVKRKVKMVTILIEILDEPQREKLAAKLERGKHGKTGKRGRHGRYDRSDRGDQPAQP